MYIIINMDTPKLIILFLLIYKINNVIYIYLHKYVYHHYYCYKLKLNTDIRYI